MEDRKAVQRRALEEQLQKGIRDGAVSEVRLGALRRKGAVNSYEWRVFDLVVNL